MLDHVAGGSAADAAISVCAPVSLHVRMRIHRELGALWRGLAALCYGTPDRLLPAFGSFRRAAYPIRLEPGSPGYVAVFRDTLDALELRQRLRDARGSRIPLLVVHGTDDGVIPVSQASEIDDAVGMEGALMTVEGLHHLDLLLDPATVGRIIGWMDGQVPVRAAA